MTGLALGSEQASPTFADSKLKSSFRRRGGDEGEQLLAPATSLTFAQHVHRSGVDLWLIPAKVGENGDCADCPTADCWCNAIVNHSSHRRLTACIILRVSSLSFPKLTIPFAPFPYAWPFSNSNNLQLSFNCLLPDKEHIFFN